VTKALTIIQKELETTAALCGVTKLDNVTTGTLQAGTF
jgi:isopentenyl diphosphate isomerase/L-lactate dehydrogenase-like FMN-dependent dehydrogenase